MNSQQRGGKKGRKIGRNKVKCQSYASRHIREKNKLRKLKQLLKKQPHNRQLLEQIENLKQYE